MNDNNIKSYSLDYYGEYVFYEEQDFIRDKEDGKYILEKLKESNRFDYNHASYTITKYGNISEGRTKNNVLIEIDTNDINVQIDGKKIHLNLIYKMDVKKLEDHYRVTTKISEPSQKLSALLYVNLVDGENFINDLNKVKDKQIELYNTSK